MIWMNSEHYKSRERLTGLLRKVDLVFGKVAYGERGCKVSEVLSELTAAQGFVPVTDSIWFLRVLILKKGRSFLPVFALCSQCVIT